MTCNLIIRNAPVTLLLGFLLVYLSACASPGAATEEAALFTVATATPVSVTSTSKSGATPQAIGAATATTAPTSTQVTATSEYTATPQVDEPATPSPTPTTAATTPAATPSLQVQIIVDNTRPRQTMEGFGASHLPLVYEGRGDVLPPALRAQAIEAVHNQVGISMGNLEGALLESTGSFDQRTNDDDDPFHFNWNGFQTFTADAMKTQVVDLAEPYGFDNYFLSQKVNTRWAIPWLVDVRAVDYNRYLDEAAENIAAGHIYWRDTLGVTPRYQMLFNEPLSGSRELVNGNVQEIVDLIKRVGDRLRSEGFEEVRFVLPNQEKVQNSITAVAAILADPEARQYVGAIGYHVYPYSSIYASIPKLLSTSGAGNPDRHRIDLRNQLRDLAQPYGIPLWMTEVSHGNVHPLSFDALRGRAIHIHDELIYADAAAYFGMLNMWDSFSHQEHFGNDDLFSTEATIALVDIDSETVYITGMGYAIGHYARWFDRGAIRIEATSSDPLLQVTAFRDDGQGRLVLVIINNAPAGRTVTVSLVGLAVSETLAGEQSTADAYWQPLTTLPPANDANFTLTVPAESVTTIAAPLVPVSSNQ